MQALPAGTPAASTCVLAHSRTPPPATHRPVPTLHQQPSVFRDLLRHGSTLDPAQTDRHVRRTGQPPGFPYGEQVLFVANDWHAAMVPSYLAARYRRNGVYKDARSIFAIHNLSHQGVEPADNFGALGLPEDWCARGCSFLTLALGPADLGRALSTLAGAGGSVAS